MSQIDLFSLLVGALSGFLIGWGIQWIWDSRQRRQDEIAFHAEMDELQGAMNRALTARASMEKERDAALERVAGLTAGNATLDEQLALKRQEAEKMKDELGISEVKLRQMAAIDQANQQLRDKLTDYEGRTRDLETKCKVLENDTKDMSLLREQLTAAQGQVEQLRTDKQTLRDNLASAEAEMATITAQMQTASEDLGEAESLRGQYAESQREVERLRANLAASTAQNERVTAINLENSELRSRLESSENELLDTNNRLVAADVRLQNVTDQLTDNRMRADMLEKELDAVRGTGRELLTVETTKLKAELGAANSYIDQLKSELTTVKADTALINVLKAENDNLRSQLAAGAPALAVAAAPAPDTNGAIPDRLQMINGIGNVFARRLNDSGVHSYRELAALAPDRLIEIVQAKPWQNIDPESWIAQAEQLAGGEGIA